MLKQIKTLTKLLLCNFWGINEFRFSKENNKKARFVLMAASIGMLAVLYMVYVALSTAAYIEMGLSDILPAYMLTLTSSIILFFSIYKAGNIIFQMKSYETLIAMPVSPAAIIVSRFITMYINNMALSLVTFAPIIVVYGYCLNPSITFYVMMFFTIFLTPLLPMTVATAIGAFIIAVSSRTKHKTFINITLTLAFVVGIIVVPMLFSGNTDVQMEEIMTNLSVVLSEKINSMYPPAKLFTNALINGSVGSYLLFSGISIGAFWLLVWLIQWQFVTICSLLKAKEVKGNYKIHGLEQHSKLKAMIFREIKHYFSSSVYVINTMIGFIMMAIVGFFILFMGVDSFEKMIGMPGIFSKAGAFFIGATGAITSTTASSISMEGKQFWLLQTMPVSTKTIIDSKILLNIIIAFPFYLITEICILLSNKFDLIECVWFIVIPIVYIIFSSVVGITMNLRFPMMNWENETVVVKQSPAVMLTMLVNLVSYGIPIAILIFARTVNVNVIRGISIISIILVILFLYYCNIKKIFKKRLQI